MNILAIETSCDDTCVSIIKVKSQKSPKQNKFATGQAKVKNFDILSNIVSSQVKVHAKYGGVYPTLAKREHQKNLPQVLEKAFKEAKSPKLDLITVTIGPGLEPCLWVGVNFAKELAKKLKLPIVPVNHIEAHIYANWLKLNNVNSKSSIVNRKEIFPAVCLVVSGGHTQLISMINFGKYKILGETRDDAAGECFDKVARILGLGYPGGPAIETEAAKLKSGKFNKIFTSVNFLPKLPRPMIYHKNYDFSFSGLKTAVFYNYKSQLQKIRKSKGYIIAMCAEAQQAIIDVLIHKTLRAAKEYKARTIILGGGVTANNELRKQFLSNIKDQIPGVKFLVPPKRFSTDNAAMVAVAGYYQWLKRKTKDWGDIEAKANLRVS